MKPASFLIVSTLALSIGAETRLRANSLNGFDLSNATIPRAEILSGGPPRDGIPSIDTPRFVEVGDADYLKDDDIVIGVKLNGIARAYPLRILIWHEIVNDVIDKQPFAVTYCPLCGTAMVFDALVGDRRRSFGVSGLLYQSDVLMYDRETESLWSQLKMEAFSGPEAGEKLTLFPSEHMTWKAWKEKNPDSSVLSPETGHRRNYQGNAYASYFASDKTMFPVPMTRKELGNKDWVLGVVMDGEAQAYPVKELPDDKELRDTIAGKTVRLIWDADSRHPILQDEEGKPIPYVMAFWFAWQAFYPGTGLWTP